MLIYPSLEKFYSSYKLQFNCTNNVAEYEALIQGLQLAQKRGIKSLRVHGDSNFVVNQVRNQNIKNNEFLKTYKQRVWDLLEGFQAFNIQSVPRRENKHANMHATIGAQYDVPKHVEDDKEKYI